MEIADLGRHGEAFGRSDPLWAILSDPKKVEGRWDVEEFFATGVKQVRALMSQMAALRISVPKG